MTKALSYRMHTHMMAETRGSVGFEQASGQQLAHLSILFRTRPAHCARCSAAYGRPTLQRARHWHMKTYALWQSAGFLLYFRGARSGVAL